MKTRKTQRIMFGICFTALSLIMLQACTGQESTSPDKLCGCWAAKDGNRPDVEIFCEGSEYKVTVFSRSGIPHRMKPETYLLQKDQGHLFINTGFRTDISYNEKTDVLSFSSHGDYIRKNKQQ